MLSGFVKEVLREIDAFISPSKLTSRVVGPNLAKAEKEARQRPRHFHGLFLSKSAFVPFLYQYDSKILTSDNAAYV
jgi:hypothetical protein